MVTILRTLRNHWKKSTFGAVVITYVSGMVKDKIKTNEMMRVYCEEAKKFGDEIIGVGVKPRHVTVILNPAARNGKGKKLFENYCSPLLNLAGIRVSTITTEHEGQARDLMEIMENTDAVIVAGGDGTLHEAVTGLLRRADEELATSKMAIGIAPIGHSNTLAKYLYPGEYKYEEQLLADTTMAVINQIVRPVDVIKIQGNENKPVFALTQLDFGAYRDNDLKIQKYWYFGFLKTKLTYLFAAAKTLPQDINLTFSHTKFCSGCSKCYIKKAKIEPMPVIQSQSGQSGKWWSAFIPKNPTLITSAIENNAATPEADFSNVVNGECGQWLSEPVYCSNITLSTNEKQNEKGIAVRMQDPLQSRTQFIKQGWARNNQLNKESVANNLTISEGKLEITIPEGEEEEPRWLSIDKENYEVQNVHVTLLPRKILMYAAVPT